MKTEKKVLGTIAFSLLVLFGVFFNILTIQQAGIILGVAASGTGIIYIVNTGKFKQWKNELKNQQQGLEVADVEKIADDWAASFYGEGDQVRINWETDFDTVELGDEEVVSLIGATGPGNKDILLFVEINKKRRPVGKKKIQHPHMRKYPFQYSDYVQEKKKERRSLDEEQLQQMQAGMYQQPVRYGMPPGRKPEPQPENEE